MQEEKVDKALRWPIAIMAGIVFIVILSGATIWIALKNPVQEANDFIKTYKEVDKGINDILEANHAFNSKYTLVFSTKALTVKECIVTYTITNKSGKAVNNAKIEALLTRPNETLNDRKLELESVKEGLYSFKKLDLPKQGRWNLFANVSIGEDKGFLKLRLDTRHPGKQFDFSEVWQENY